MSGYWLMTTYYKVCGGVCDPWQGHGRAQVWWTSAVRCHKVDLDQVQVGWPARNACCIRLSGMLYDSSWGSLREYDQFGQTWAQCLQDTI